jgi:type IV pilus assembly protein PilC
MLALLAERGQRLDSSVLLAGRVNRGIVGRAAARLLTAVRRGAPLEEAIAAYPRALPPEAVAYVAAGQTLQAEAAALRELSRSDHSELAALWRACVDRLTYLAFVLIIMVSVLTFIMIKILPEFNVIFSEFNIALPAATTLAIRFADVFQTYLAAPIGGLVVVSLLCAIPIGIAYLSDVPVLRPWSDWLFRRRRSTHVLRILAVATEQRQPLAEVLHRLAYVYPSAPIRSRLRAAAGAVHAGADWRDALRRAWIVSRAEHSLLKAAERAGNLPWALRQIAQRREKRGVYQLATALQVLYPVTIVSLGGFVGFYVVSLFVPIVQLINGLAY